MLLSYGIILLFAGLTKVIEEKNIKFLPVVYFIFMFVLAMVASGGKDVGPIAMVLAIRSVLVYIWLALLHKADSTIFTYFVVLVAGVYLINLI